MLRTFSLLIALSISSIFCPNTIRGVVTVAAGNLRVIPNVLRKSVGSSIVFGHQCLTLVIYFLETQPLSGINLIQYLLTNNWLIIGDYEVHRFHCAYCLGCYGSFVDPVLMWNLTGTYTNIVPQNFHRGVEISVRAISSTERACQIFYVACTIKTCNRTIKKR